MDLCLSLCWFYMVSNVISERLNITGSSFQKDKYMDSNPMIIFDKIGPRQCIKYCMLHNGCNAVNFKRNDLHCELLALLNSNPSLIDVTEIYFTEITDWEQDKHACWPNPCTGQTKCEAAYYNQYICVTYDTPCSSQPCTNGGTCRNQFESFLCICPAGYNGQVCEYTPCTDTNCNHGECVISGSSFYCSCWSGYYGDRCENTPCTGQNCNYGSCVIIGSTFDCSCWAGHYGSRCEYTPCTGQYCNYGSCVVSGSNFYCSCWSGYYGSSCQYSYTYIYVAKSIESPNYPSYYYDNAVISWSYGTDAGRRISVVAVVFYLEENFDWLKVYHRPDKVTELASWTGTQSFIIVYSLDNYVYIEFTTDASITSTGFQIVVSTE
ncbi:unnamed protein product [Mytilus coruscus]|uniref:Uncharacterized protein n=1 Tax=Mytilus coruscus TaxID=42192 RepID=A0A6J8EPD7_MYTCO|nr:unnamed protein product [Mytilus coruscus]